MLVGLEFNKIKESEMELPYVSFNLYQSVNDGGIILVSTKEGVGSHYKTKKEAIKYLCQWVASYISCTFPPDNGGSYNDKEFDKWYKDFKQKLEWISKD